MPNPMPKPSLDCLGWSVRYKCDVRGEPVAETGKTIYGFASKVFLNPDDVVIAHMLATAWGAELTEITKRNQIFFRHTNW